MANGLVKIKGKRTVIEQVTKTHQVWHTPITHIPTPSSGGSSSVTIPKPQPKIIERTNSQMINCVRNGKQGQQMALVDSKGNVIKLIGECIISDGLGF